MRATSKPVDELDTAEQASVPGTPGPDVPPGRADRWTERGWRRRLCGHRGRAAFVVLLVLYCVELSVNTARMQLDSDKVWAQTILAMRGRFGPTTILSSPDTFVIKYPLYLVANRLFGLTYRAVAFEVIVIGLVFYLSIALAYALLVRCRVLPAAPWSLVVLIGAWVISVGDPTTTLVHPNERNAELGLGLLVLVIAGLLFLGHIGARMRTPLRAVSTVVLAAAGALLIYDDPYNLYLILLPLVVVAVIRAAQAGSAREVVGERAPYLWAFIAITGVLYGAANVIGRHAGLQPYSTGDLGMHFLAADSLSTSAQGAVSSVSAVYNGLFFGQPVKSAAAHLVLNAGLGLTVLGCGVTLLRGWHQRDIAARLLVPLAGATMFALYVVSGNAAATGRQRYLVVLVPVSFLIAPGALARLRGGEQGRVVFRVLIGLFALSIVLNAAATVRNAPMPMRKWTYTNATYLAREKTIARLGLGKGYAGYWDANMNTYDSGGRQLTIGVKCSGRQLRVYYWLIDTSWLNKPASRSYLIYDRNDSTFRACTVPRLHRQFGAPALSVPLETPGVRLFVYDYDILDRMPPRKDTTHP